MIGFVSLLGDKMFFVCSPFHATLFVTAQVTWPTRWMRRVDRLQMFSWDYALKSRLNGLARPLPFAPFIGSFAMRRPSAPLFESRCRLGSVKKWGINRSRRWPSKPQRRFRFYCPFFSVFGRPIGFNSAGKFAEYESYPLGIYAGNVTEIFHELSGQSYTFAIVIDQSQK